MSWLQSNTNRSRRNGHRQPLSLCRVSINQACQTHFTGLCCGAEYLAWKMFFFVGKTREFAAENDHLNIKIIFHEMFLCKMQWNVKKKTSPVSVASCAFFQSHSNHRVLSEVSFAVRWLAFMAASEISHIMCQCCVHCSKEMYFLVWWIIGQYWASCSLLLENVPHVWHTSSKHMQCPLLP